MELENQQFHREFYVYKVIDIDSVGGDGNEDYSNEFKSIFIKQDKLNESNYGDVLYLHEKNSLVVISSENTQQQDDKLVAYDDKLDWLLSLFLYDKNVKICSKNLKCERIFKLDENFYQDLVILNYVEYMFINIFNINISNVKILSGQDYDIKIYKNYNYNDLSKDKWSRTSEKCRKKIQEATFEILKTFFDGNNHNLDFEKLPKFNSDLIIDDKIKKEINKIYYIIDEYTLQLFLEKFFDLCTQTNNPNLNFGYEYFINPVLDNRKHKFPSETTESQLIELCLSNYKWKYIECTICRNFCCFFEDSQNNKFLKMEKCKHVFHGTCFEEWSDLLIKDTVEKTELGKMEKEEELEKMKKCLFCKN